MKKKKAVNVLYAEWAINHAKLMKGIMEKMSSNCNGMRLNDAMMEALEELADEDENYELAMTVVFPKEERA